MEHETNPEGAGLRARWTTRIAATALVLAAPLVATGQDLTLSVGVTSGDVFIENTTGSAVAFDGYEIFSSSGSLLAGGWLSIADNYDVSGDQSVDSTSEWLEISSVDISIAEATLDLLTGGLGSGERINLGPIWSVTGNADLTLEYQAGSTTFSAQTNYFLEADIDRDNLVTAGDYTILRDSIGAAGTSADVNNDGLVDAADFNGFQLQFGEANPVVAFAASSAAFSAVVVPEPSTVVLTFFPVVASTVSWRRRR